MTIVEQQSTLAPREIAELFQTLRFSLEGEQESLREKLAELQPKQYEVKDIIWRSRLLGFSECLCSVNIIHKTLLEQIRNTLFSKKPTTSDHRSNRTEPFYIDVNTGGDQLFSFNVPAVNPNDAYAQLSRRVIYRSITKIQSVRVFAGRLEERNENDTPVRTYTQDELICA